MHLFRPPVNAVHEMQLKVADKRGYNTQRSTPAWEKKRSTRKRQGNQTRELQQCTGEYLLDTPEVLRFLACYFSFVLFIFLDICQPGTLYPAPEICQPGILYPAPEITSRLAGRNPVHFPRGSGPSTIRRVIQCACLWSRLYVWSSGGDVGVEEQVA